MKWEEIRNFLNPSTPTWQPPVLTCSAKEMSGIESVWDTVLEHKEKLLTTGELAEKRRKQALDWMWSLVEEGLRERFRKNAEIRKLLPRLIWEVEKGETAPTLAAASLLSLLDSSAT